MKFSIDKVGSVFNIIGVCFVVWFAWTTTTSPESQHRILGFVIFAFVAVWAVLLSWHIFFRGKKTELSNGNKADNLAGHPIPVQKIRTTEEWDEARKNLRPVMNRKFTHEEVTLDGNHYIGCTFTHVNLFYNGTAPIFIDNCTFDEDTTKHFHSRNPAMAQWIELLRNLGMLRDGLKFALTPHEPIL